MEENSSDGKEQQKIDLDTRDVTDGSQKGVGLTDIYGLSLFDGNVEEKISAYKEGNILALSKIELGVFSDEEKENREMENISKQVFKETQGVVKEENVVIPKNTDPPYLLIGEIMLVIIVLVGYIYYKKKKKEREIHLDNLDDTDQF